MTHVVNLCKRKATNLSIWGVDYYPSGHPFPNCGWVIGFYQIMKMISKQGCDMMGPMKNGNMDGTKIVEQNEDC